MNSYRSVMTPWSSQTGNPHTPALSLCLPPAPPSSYSLAPLRAALNPAANPSIVFLLLIFSALLSSSSLSLYTPVYIPSRSLPLSVVSPALSTLFYLGRIKVKRGPAEKKEATSRKLTHSTAHTYCFARTRIPTQRPLRNSTHDLTLSPGR